MFTRLKLTNFKAWQKTGDIKLKPVTMLLGTNSSGKSSLIQSLLLLKQTARSPDRTIHLNLGGDEVNDLFNFGNFEDVFHKSGDSKRQFSITFDFKRPDSDRIKTGTLDCLFNQTSSGSVTTQQLRLKAGDRMFRAVRREKGAFSIFVDDEPQPRVKGRNYAPERSIAFSADAIAELDKDGQLVEDISLSIRRELESVAYLGPLRRKPERDYPWNRGKPGDLGSDGKGAIDALLASSLLKGSEQNYVVDEVSRWLSRMNIADKLEVRQQGRSNRYELIVHRDGVACNLRDVGIGISQVLPVLVVSFFAPSGSTIILEEPEIHLHPLAQATLAELFVETSKKRNVQFVVETHSEHLFRRMQTLIAQKKSVLSETSMYFVERDGPAAKLRTLDVDEFGRVKNWPEGFFGDAMGETREQARLMFKRQKAARE
jgi:energy-coupling factor transporter ATP-binding protein EcfA2